jgi:hypothetical protein
VAIEEEEEEVGIKSVLIFSTDIQKKISNVRIHESLSSTGRRVVPYRQAGHDEAGSRIS